MLFLYDTSRDQIFLSYKEIIKVIKVINLQSLRSHHTVALALTNLYVYVLFFFFMIIIKVVIKMINLLYLIFVALTIAFFDKFNI
jgi:hypothetical protein